MMKDENNILQSWRARPISNGTRDFILRATFFCVALVSVLLMPWWVSALILFSALFTRGAYEMILVAALMDALYGTGLWYSAAALLAAALTLFIRQRLFV